MDLIQVFIYVIQLRTEFSFVILLHKNWLESGMNVWTLKPIFLPLSIAKWKVQKIVL